MSRPLAEQHALIESCDDLVFWVVNRMNRQGTYCREDLIQAGRVGLVNAARLFDETKGVKFATYAFWSIRSWVIAEIRKTAPVHVPQRMPIGVAQTYRAADIDSLVSSRTREKRRDFGPWNKDRDEFFVDESPGPHEAAVQNEQIRAVLRVLDERQREVITQCYLTGAYVSYKDLAVRRGVTRQAISLVARAAIAKAREALCNQYPVQEGA